MKDIKTSLANKNQLKLIIFLVFNFMYSYILYFFYKISLNELAITEKDDRLKYK